MEVFNTKPDELRNKQWNLRFSLYFFLCVSLLMWCFAGVENTWATVAAVIRLQAVVVIVVQNGVTVAQKTQRRDLAGEYRSIDDHQYQQIQSPTGWSLASHGWRVVSHCCCCCCCPLFQNNNRLSFLTKLHTHTQTKPPSAQLFNQKLLVLEQQGSSLFAPNVAPQRRF